jgi:predicted HD phosphohydrolase
MAKSQPTRRTITWSEETDSEVQAFLGSEEDISKFVEDAVRWRIFDRTVQVVKERNASMDPEVLQGIIDDAVKESRRELAQQRARAVAFSSCG